MTKTSHFLWLQRMLHHLSYYFDSSLHQMIIVIRWFISINTRELHYTFLCNSISTFAHTHWTSVHCIVVFYMWHIFTIIYYNLNVFITWFITRHFVIFFQHLAYCHTVIIHWFIIFAVFIITGCYSTWSNGFAFIMIEGTALGNKRLTVVYPSVWWKQFWSKWSLHIVALLGTIEILMAHIHFLFKSTLFGNLYLQNQLHLAND